MARGATGSTDAADPSAGPIGRVIHSRFGPIVTAVVLSLAATPIAAATIANMYVSSADRSPAVPDPAIYIAMALVAVATAGLVAGEIGRRALRRSPVRALLLVVAVAWPVAITTLPIVPAVMGYSFSAMGTCFTGCNPGLWPALTSADLLSGATLYAGSLVLASVTIVPLALALTFVVAGRRAYPAQLEKAAALGLLAIACLNAPWVVEILGSDPQAVWDYAGLAFACLVVGAVVWVAPYWHLPRSGLRPAVRYPPLAPIDHRVAMPGQPARTYGLRRRRPPPE